MKRRFLSTTRLSFALASAMVASLALTSTVSRAATYYWDSNSTTAGFGTTTGTWGTSTFWSTSSAGTGATANTTILATDTVNFGTATLNYGNAAVAVTGTVNVNAIFFGAGQTTALTLSGGTITLGGTAPSIVVNNTTNTISSVLAGTLGLAKTGTGTLTLSGANTFSGPTTVSAGTVTLNNALAIQNSALVTTASGTVTLGAGVTTPTFGGLSGATGNLGTGTMLATGYSGVTALTLNPQFGISVTYGGTISNGSGAMTLTKNGAGTQVLSGTNTYTGKTTLNAGSLQFARQASLYNGNTGSWTAANLNVKGGATLALNVDSGGTAGFDNANLNTLLTNISLANTAAEGLQSGAILALDTTTASGGTFTPTSAISNSTGAFGGAVGLTKLGAGTLVLDQTNTFTGATLISAGTLQIGGAGSLGSGAYAGSIGNTGTLTYSSSTSQILSGILSGSGSLIKDTSASSTLTLSAANSYTGTTTVSAGTLALTNARALQNSALVTTGGGTVTLSGVTTPTFGGLSGATGDLASVISSGYSGVTALTLNPNANSVTYGGAIANGAAGMTLTKTGSGTQVLQGVNSYSGATTLSAGTLELSGAAGSITGTTGYTLNGGGLTLTNINDTEGALDRVAAVGITSNGGTITYNNTATGTAYAETLGTVALTTGQLNVVSTNAVTTGTQTLTFGAGSLTHAAANTSAITFSGASLGLNERNSILVTSEATTGVGTIIGPWATIGTSAGAQTDYAAYNITGGTTNAFGIQNANIAAVTDVNWTDSTKAYTSGVGGALALGATAHNMLGLRNTGATTVMTIPTGGNLNTYGLLNGAGTAWTVAATGTGALSTPAGGGNLHVNSGNFAMTISAPINDNGGAVTLVKNGNFSLTLSSTTSNFSGGIVLNAGTLVAAVDTNLGAASNGITFNGSAFFQPGTGTYARSIALNNGAIASFNGNNPIFTGNVTGTGGVAMNSAFGQQTTFSGTGNTFEGPVLIGSTGTGGQAYRFQFSSLADSPAANGRISFVSSLVTHADGSVFQYNGATNLTLANRQIEIASTGGTPTFGHQIRSTGTGTLSINTDLLVTSNANPQTLALRGTNTGANTFAGRIVDGTGPAVVSLTKITDAGTWVLSGANTYSGTTTIGAGVLRLTNGSALGSTVGGTTQSGTSALEIDGSGGAVIVGAEPLTINGGGITNFGALRNIAGDNTYGGTVTMAAQSRINSDSGTLTLSNATAAVTGAFNLVVGGAGNTTISGPMTNGTGGVLKDGAGTLTLSGINTYTGGTAVNAGVVRAGAAAGGQAFGNLSAVTTANDASAILDLNNFSQTIGSLAGSGLLGGNVTLGTGTLTTGGLNTNTTYAGSISSSTGGGLTKVGTGTQTLTGANAFNGATTITGGTLQLGNGTATGSLSPGSAIGIGTGATFAVNQSDTVTQGTDFSSTITGNGTFLQSGSGTTVLNVANGYTGFTTINSGTLALAFGGVSSNILAPSSALTLGGGALQLTGTGTQTIAGLTTSAATVSSIMLGANQTLTFGALTLAGAASSLNFNTATGGANATTPAIGTGIVVLAGQTPGNVINPGFTVTDAGGFGLATVNGTNQVIRLTSGTLLPATGATAVTDYRIDNNPGGIAADGSSSLTVTASEGARSITVDTTTASGILTLNPGVTLSNDTWNFGGSGSNTYQITGGTGLNSTASNNAINISNYTAGPVTFASPILANGANNVVVSGTGTTVFSNTNTYTGSTTIGSGILNANSSGALGTGVAANTLIFTGGTLQAGGTITSPATRGVTLTSTGVIDTNSNDISIAGVIGGAGGLTKSGPGTLTLTGNNTFTGTVAVNAGTLSLTPVGLLTLGNSFTGPGTLNINPAAVAAANLTLNGNLSGFAGTVNVATSGATSSKLVTSGLLSSFGAGTIINVAGGGTWLNTINQTGITLNLSGTGNSESLGALRLDAGTIDSTSSVVLKANASIGANSGTGTINAPVSEDAGSFSLTKQGAGTIVLGGALSHTGGITVSAGTLTLGNPGNTYSGTTLINAAGRGLIVTADGALGATGAAHGTTVTGAGTGNGGALGFSGGINYSTTEIITGSGAGHTTGSLPGFTSANRGFIQSVSGNNTFAGPIELSAGSTSRIGTQDGASLTLSGAITQASGITDANILFRVGSTSGDFVTLSNAGNSFGGDSTIFTGATSGYAGVRLGVNHALPTGLTVSGFSGTAATTTALDTAGFNQSLNGLTTGGGTLNIINLNTITPSTLTLNPTADKASSNTLLLGGGGLGVINVVKEGSFTQTLSGTNTYSGTTTVSAGTLIINGNHSGATGAITVAAGATLGGSGTLGGPVITSGVSTILAPGTSPGTLTVASLDASAGATFNAEVGTPATDLITMAGAFTGSTAPGGLVWNLSDAGGLLANTPYNLINFGSSIGFESGDLAVGTLSGGLVLDPAFGTGGFQITANSLQVQFSAVPEPTTTVTLLAGLGLLLGRRRRTA